MPVVVLFWMQSCPHCDDLKIELSPEGKENLLKKMILIEKDDKTIADVKTNDIQVDDKFLNKIWEYRTNVSGYPTLVKFDDNGEKPTEFKEEKRDYESIEAFIKTPEKVGGKRFRQRKTFFKRRHHKTNKHYNGFHKHNKKNKTKKSWWNIFGL